MNILPSGLNFHLSYCLDFKFPIFTEGFLSGFLETEFSFKPGCFCLFLHSSITSEFSLFEESEGKSSLFNAVDCSKIQELKVLHELFS